MRAKGADNSNKYARLVRARALRDTTKQMRKRALWRQVVVGRS